MADPQRTPGRRPIEPLAPGQSLAATSPGRCPRFRYLASQVLRTQRKHAEGRTPSGNPLTTRSAVPSPPAAITARNLFRSNSCRVRARKDATSENTAGRNRRDRRSSTSSQPLARSDRDLRIGSAESPPRRRYPQAARSEASLGIGPYAPLPGPAGPPASQNETSGAT